MTHLSRFVAAFLALGLALAAHAAPVRFDIPAQPAAAALKAFGKQAQVEVIFRADELKDIQAGAVKGEFEPVEAITRLLAGTGFEARQTAATNFIVTKVKAVTTGSVRGSLAFPSGAPAVGVLVVVRDTAQSVETDKAGQFFFNSVAPRSHVLVATAPGCQPLHITDVVVKAGNELALSRETFHKPGEGVTVLEPFVVQGEAITELDKFEVTGMKQKPFAAGNLDIPRTTSDVQPYYIFDTATIETSGATNVEDLLKQRLTMNAVIQTNSQNPNSGLGNTSSINLRGVGTDKTLILIDGRRRPGVSLAGTDYQTDLNGIPVDMIERIEVLPSSASGIYGGSAIGGVVNIITKRNYRGGEIRMTYDNSVDTDSARRKVSASYGWMLEGGKTHLTINGSWSDANDLLLQDRLDLVRANFATIMSNSPTFVTSAYTLWRGVRPNITTTAANLVLKNGTSLNSKQTYVPAGTSASTGSSTLAGGLLSNAGQWNLDFPADANTTNGRLLSLGNLPRTRSFGVSLRRQMRPWLEAYADFLVDENNTVAAYGTGSGTVALSAGVAGNPFTTAVTVTLSDPRPNYLVTKNQSGSVRAGFVAQLPAGWTAALDYTGSQNRFDYAYTTPDTTARTADARSGVLNLFVDQSLYPLDLDKYDGSVTNQTRIQIHDVTLKGAGKLPALPWGRPNLTVGLEHRIERVPESKVVRDYPITTANAYTVDYYPRQSTADSGYAEAIVPLVKTDWLPGLHALELQASGRAERYTVDTGTTYQLTYYKRSPVVTTYSGALQNGQPSFSQARYDSTNYTVGLKYQPIKDVTLRASRATAFLPPTMTQLAETQDKSTFTTNVIDPKTGQTAAVYTIGGGNADLAPQTSSSTNLGLIWEPTWQPLQGLRVNVEYYQIKQFDAISTLSAQQIVDQESVYPDRVTRDTSGNITLVNTSNLNLYSQETEGWDLSAGYARKTALGTFRLDAVESIVTRLKSQYSQTAPAYDAVNFPSEGGSVKYKGNVTLTWDWHNWTAGWTTRYYGRYKQYGAAGGPSSLQYSGGGTYYIYAAAQGGDWVKAQTFHDVFFGYAFGKQRGADDFQRSALSSKLLSGLTVRLGVRNVFDQASALDAFYGSTQLFMSPYGDMRLRTYWLSLKKAF